MGYIFIPINQKQKFKPFSFFLSFIAVYFLFCFITRLQDEMAALDEQLAKLTKDKKRLEEANSRTGESLAQEEDKVRHLSKAKAKLEQQLDEAEEQVEREKRERADLDKARRKLDSELKSTASSLEDMERQKRDVEELVKQKSAEIANLSSRLEDEHGHVAAAQKKNKELQALLVEAEEVGLYSGRLLIGLFLQIFSRNLSLSKKANGPLI